MKIIGTKKNDTLVGEAGDDVIKGKKGDDILMAKDGLDILKGGRGADTFFVPTDSFSFIKDFKPEQGDRVIVYLPEIETGDLGARVDPDVGFTSPMLTYKGEPVAAVYKASDASADDFLFVG